MLTYLRLLKMLLPLLILFCWNCVDAGPNSQQEESLQMKVNGEDIIGKKFAINDKIYYIQEDYEYVEGQSLNFTCEAVNFDKNVGPYFLTAPKILDLYTFFESEAKKMFMSKIAEENKLTISYKPSTNYSLLCRTDMDTGPYVRKGKHTFVINFKENTRKEPSERVKEVKYTPTTNEIVLAISLIVTIVVIIIILIILIKMYRKHKILQSDMRVDLIPTNNESKPNENDYSENQNDARTSNTYCTPYSPSEHSSEAPKKFRYTHEIIEYINGKNLENNKINNNIHDYGNGSINKFDYENGNTNKNDHENGNMNKNDYENGNTNKNVDFYNEEWTTNSAYDTLSNLYYEIK